MKLIFMGTPDFAVPCLDILIKDGHEIPLVVTQPDRQRGRGHKVTFSPVKEKALENNIEVFQPESLKNGEMDDKLRIINPDVIVVVAYGKMLPESVLNYPKFGCVNVHGSLLPKLRGAAPVQRAVMNGDKISGITTMKLNSGMDTGDMLLKFPVEISEDDTAGTLFEKLKIVGATAISKTLTKLERGDIKPVPQNDADATYAPMITKEEANINWGEDAETLINKIRGLNPAPVAYTYYKGKKVKIYEAVIGEDTDDTDYGKVWGYFEEKGLGIVGNGKIIYINEFHMENSKRMAVSEYMRGHSIEPGDYFTDKI